MASSHKIEPIERFPTTPRADGRFQKRILGQLYYFGSGGDRKNALIEYDRVKHDLYAGRKPRNAVDAPTLTLKQLANLFTDEKEAQTKAKDITASHMRSYRRALKRFLKYFGAARLVADVGPDDFANYSRHLRGKIKLGSHAFNRERACIVAMFNHAEESGWIQHPIRFGRGFKKASESELRGNRKSRLMDAADLRKLIDKSAGQLRAMILLGINAGFGATDCAILAREDVDLGTGRIDTIRRKRKVIRHAPLWPETVTALRAVMAERKDDDLVFRRDSGKPWVADTDKANVNAVTKEFATLADDLKIKRAPGASFGILRHTFATLAKGMKDDDGYKRIMGHRLEGLDDTYIEAIDWERLKEITDHVRSKVLSSPGNGPSPKKRKRQRA